MHSPWRLRTNVGRVVYNRKPHYYKVADVERIAGAVFWRAGPDRSILADLLYTISVAMLRRILLLFGADLWAQTVYLFVENFVGKTLELLLGEGYALEAKRLVETIDDQAVALGVSPSETTTV